MALLLLLLRLLRLLRRRKMENLTMLVKLIEKIGQQCTVHNVFIWFFFSFQTFSSKRVLHINRTIQSLFDIFEIQPIPYENLCQKFNSFLNSSHIKFPIVIGAKILHIEFSFIFDRNWRWAIQKWSENKANCWRCFEREIEKKNGTEYTFEYDGCLSVYVFVLLFVSLIMVASEAPPHHLSSLCEQSIPKMPKTKLAFELNELESNQTDRPTHTQLKCTTHIINKMKCDRQWISNISLSRMPWKTIIWSEKHIIVSLYRTAFIDQTCWCMHCRVNMRCAFAYYSLSTFLFFSLCAMIKSWYY